MKHILFVMFTPFGRASRVMYLAGYGLWMIALPVLSQFVLRLFPMPRDSLGLPVFMPYIPLLSLWIIWCLIVNRLHDLNRSGAWAIIPIFIPLAVMSVIGGFSQAAIGWGGILSIYFVPVLYMALGLILVFFRGSAAPNRFGERPNLALS